MGILVLILIKRQSQMVKPTITNTNNNELVSFTLRNKQGSSVEILNLGGIIRSIKTPDRSGVFKDITLGFTSPKQYLDEHPYFGAIVGRFANRIANGKFELEGKEYILVQNNGPNHLHGELWVLITCFGKWILLKMKMEFNSATFPQTEKKGILEICQ